MNSWTVSGVVESFNEKGGLYKKLWIKIAAPLAPNNTRNNTLFITIDKPDKPIYYDKILGMLQSGLYPYLFAYDCTLCPIKSAKKKEDGTWEEFFRTGIKTNIHRIVLSKECGQEINIGMLTGTIIKKKDNKLIVEESYRSPKKGYLTREVPILLSPEQNFSFISPGSKCFFLSSLSSGEDNSKLHGYCKAISLLNG